MNASDHAPTKSLRVTFDVVLTALRTRHFAVLSTVDESGTPHAAGVTIAVGVVIALALTARLTANGINAWWLLLIGVFAPLISSVFRAIRSN